MPFPSKFYGSIDCFLVDCVRRGALGFLNETSMRIHARNRHRLEYQAHIETQTAAKADEVTELRNRLDTLMASMAQRSLAQAVTTLVETESPKEILKNPSAQMESPKKKPGIPKGEHRERTEPQKEHDKEFGRLAKERWEARQAAAKAV